MIDADRTKVCASDSDAGTPSANNHDDYTEYIADMILEMQRLAAKTGRSKLAERLLAAYELARNDKASER